MINNKGELMTSIPKNCKDYSPDKQKPTGVKCDKLGKLYKCNNHKGERSGCLFCEKHETKTKKGKLITGIEINKHVQEINKLYKEYSVGWNLSLDEDEKPIDNLRSGLESDISMLEELAEKLDARLALINEK